MKAQSLLSAIRSLGGVNIREIRDLSGEGRTGRAGIPVGVFRKPGRGKKSGLKATGFGLDELVPRLRELGFGIPDDAVDGGVQELRDMISAELSGQEKIYPMDAVEELLAMRQEEDAGEPPSPAPRLVQLARDLRQQAEWERRAA